MQRQVTIRDLWQIAWKRKLWLILPIILVTGVSFGGSYLLPTKYESRTKVVISNQKFLSPMMERTLPAEAGQLPDIRYLNYWLAAQKSEITSSKYINQMIEQLKLEPEEKITKEAAKRLEEFPDNDLPTMVRTLQIDDLKDDINVELVGENHVVIVCLSESPRTASQMAKSLAEIYRDTKLAEQVLAGDEGQVLTDNQLANAKREYDEAEKQLADFKTSYLNRQLQTGISADANLTQVESEVAATNIEIRESVDRVNFLAFRVVEAGIDTVAVTANSTPLQHHRESALDATRQVAGLMPRYLWKDGKIQSLLLRVSEALDSMRSAGQNAANRAFPAASTAVRGDIGELMYRSHEIAFLNAKQKILSDAIKEIEGVIAGQPYYDQMVKRMEDKVNDKKKALATWQEESDRVKIRRATNEAEAETKYTILEPASIPLEPAEPNRIKITIMGLALGIVLGACAVVIAEVVDHSIKRIEDIEELLGLEVVGTIPYIDPSTQVKGVKAA